MSFLNEIQRLQRGCFSSENTPLRKHELHRVHPKSTYRKMQLLMAPLQEFKRVHWVIPHFAEEYKNNLLSNNMSNQGLPVEAQFECTVPECASFVIQAWI